MQLEEVLNQTEQKFESAIKKRFACSHCGKTWVEIIGFLTLNKEEQEDVYFRLGDESANCQNCRYRIRTCPNCGSKEAYEITLSSAAQEAPLSFNRIRIVSKT
jgi:hypothetical protein